MPKRKPRNDLAALERAALASATETYVFGLFVAGMSPHSALAIANVRRFCEARLTGRFTLAVDDLLSNPGLAQREQIFATPTLIRYFPLPQRRFVGNMAEMERVLVGALPPPPVALRRP